MTRNASNLQQGVYFFLLESWGIGNVGIGKYGISHPQPNQTYTPNIEILPSTTSRFAPRRIEQTITKCRERNQITVLHLQSVREEFNIVEKVDGGDIRSARF